MFLTLTQLSGSLGVSPFRSNNSYSSNPDTSSSFPRSTFRLSHRQ